MPPKKEDASDEEELSPITSFMWLNSMHDEVPESEAIYGFGIREDGSRFVMGPRPEKVNTKTKIKNEIANRVATTKSKRMLIVPTWMRNNAKRGLEWHKEGKSGDGVTDKTLAEARTMAAGSVSPNKAMRMAAWFARHMSDLGAPAAKVGAAGYPSAGIVAHALWGGGSRTESQRAESWAKSHSPDKE